MVKKTLIYWREIAEHEISRLESEFSDETLLQLIRSNGAAGER